MNRVIITAIFALYVCAGAAFAQSGAAQRRVVSDSDFVRVDPAARGRIRAIVDSAAAASLPVEPLLDLARKARLKGVAPDSTVAAASRAMHRLMEVRGALGAAAGDEDLKAGEDALRAGMDVSTMARLRAEQKRDEPFFVTLSVVADIMEEGVPLDTAVAVMRRMLAVGVRNADLVVYRANVTSDIRLLGALPATAASVRGDATILRVGDPLGVTRNAPPTRPPATTSTIPPE